MLILLIAERYSVLPTVIALTIICRIGCIWFNWLLVHFMIFGVLTAPGVHDVRKNHTAVTKNSPSSGHSR